MKTITFITIILMLVLTSCGKGKDNVKEQKHEPAFFLPIDLCGATLDEVKQEFLQNGFTAQDSFGSYEGWTYPFLNENEHIHAWCEKNFLLESKPYSLEVYYETGFGHDSEQIKAEVEAMGATHINTGWPGASYQYGDCKLQVLCCIHTSDTSESTVLNISYLNIVR